MSSTITCDHCQKTAPRRGLVGWVTIAETTASVNIHYHGQPRGADGDYCSLDCASEAVERAIARQRGDRSTANARPEFHVHGVADPEQAARNIAKAFA